MSKNIFEIMEETDQVGYEVKTICGFCGLAAFMLVLVMALVCSAIVANGIRDAGREAGKNITNAIELQMRLQEEHLKKLAPPSELRALNH